MDSKGVNIKITSEAELSALKHAESALIKQVVAAKTLGKEYRDLEKELEKVQKQMSAIKPPLLPPPSRLQKFGGVLKEGLQEIPGVGAFSRAFNGTVPLVGGAILAVGSFYQTVKSGISTMVEGVLGVSDFAGKMSDLSAQTGQSVSDVIVLGQAFRNAGLGSEMVGQSLNLLQKALTGVNDEGQPTAEVFSRLGLSIGDLKNMSAVEQMEAIAGAIAKLPNPADQARAAMEMFGRSGGRMLAILKDTEAFATARTQVGGLAASLQTTAADLDAFSDAVGSLDVKQLGFFAGFAEGISGDLKSAASALNSMDLSGPGKAFGEMARDATNIARGLKDIADHLPKVPGGYSAGDLAGDVAKAAPRAAFDAVLPPGLGGVLRQLGGYLAERGEKSRATKTDADVSEPLALIAAPASPAELLLQEKREALNLELQIAEAARAGNKAEEEKLRWTKAYTVAKKAALDAGMDDPEIFARRTADASMPKPEDRENSPAQRGMNEISRKALEKYEAEQAANSEKRVALDLELQLAEAQADGNKEAEARVKWMIDYNRKLKELQASGESDPWDKAIRGANAEIGKTPDAGDLARKAVGVSSAARLGMAVGESSSASPVVEAIQQMITKQQSSDEFRRRTAVATETIAKQRGGYR